MEGYLRKISSVAEQFRNVGSFLLLVGFFAGMAAKAVFVIATKGGPKLVWSKGERSGISAWSAATDIRRE